MDPLHIEYLRLWLRVEPRRHELRVMLARQLAAMGDYAAARAELRAAANDTQNDDLALHEVDIGVREAYAYAPDDPRRARLLAELRAMLVALSQKTRPLDIEIELAKRATQIGASDAATIWYDRMLRRDAPLAASAWEAAAKQSLALGAHELAARLFLRAHSAAPQIEEKRRLFLTAMRTYLAGGLFDAGLAAAEAHLGKLSDDTATLEFLVRYALSANRPEVAQHYVKQLLRLAGQNSVIQMWLTRLAASLSRGWEAHADELSGQNQSFALNVDQRLPVPHLPFDDRIYTLAYDVFLANRNLKDALAVALSAVRQAPNDITWRQRLAQIADWTGNAPIALEQWHSIARMTGAPAAWREVASRAAQVFDHTRLAEALEWTLQHASGEPDLALITRLVDVYESLGEPKRAIALLRRYERGSHRQAILERLERVAERSGDDALRLEVVRVLVQENPESINHALRLAALQTQRGDTAAAFAALAKVEPHARVKDVDFWGAYADLARQTGRTQDEIRALRRLIASPAAALPHYTALVELFEHDAPDKAAALAAQGFLRFKDKYMATRALHLYQRVGDIAGARAFLGRLTPAQRSALEQDASFLLQRALLEFSAGHPNQALADARAALKLSPNDVEPQALVIWSLIALRDAPALRATLRTWAARADNERGLWAPYAAGRLALHEPRLAMRYLRRLIKTTDDPLWWISLADALEQAGDADIAWRVRRHAWHLLQRRGEEAERPDVAARLVTLATVFASSDRARERLYEFLRQHRRQRGTDPIARETALAYWISRGAAEVADGWLLATYARVLERPAWAQLSIALANDDRAAMQTLLDTLADWLPRSDRIEAARRTGQIGLAQTFAHDHLTHLSADDDVQQRFVTLATTSPQVVGLAWNSLRQRPLDERSWTVEGTINLLPRLQAGVVLQEITRTSTDGTQLVAVPATEKRQAISLRYEFVNGGVLRTQLAARDGFGRVTGLTLLGQRKVSPRLGLSMRIGLDDEATDNTFLRIGGSRNTLGMSAYTLLSRREYASVSLETNRYRALDGGTIGRGHSARIELGHYLRYEYPDLALRATLAHSHYAPQAGLEPRLATLLGSAHAGATNATLLPQSTTQYGIGIALGVSVRDRYTRVWRPWAEATLLYDELNDINSEWQIGIKGSVFGNDQLMFSLAGGSALGTNAAPYRGLNMRYHWLY